MRDTEARSRQVARNLTERYALKTAQGEEHLEITANVNGRIDRAHAAA